MEESQATSPRSEGIKFLLLVGVCAVVVIVVAVSRPFIFGHVVPVVMGEGQMEPVDMTDTAVDETDAAPAGSENMDTGVGGEVEEEGETAVDEAAPDTETVDEANAAAVGDDQAGVEETAVPSTVSHIVQVGDTVYSIARKYGVTVEDIAAANNLADPNRVMVGQTLIIPQP